MKSSSFWMILAAAWLASEPGSAGRPGVEWDWSGEYRLRAETRLDADLDASRGDERSPILQRARLAVDVRPSARVRVFLQVQDSRAFGDEASTTSNEANLDLHQGYAEVVLGAGTTLRFGRTELIYGDQRVIGAFGWDNVGRAFDGVRLRKELARGFVDGFWGRLARATEAGRDESNDDLALVYAHFAAGKHLELEPYLLAHRAATPTPSELPGKSGRSRVAAFGGRVAGTWGATRLTLEALLERGRVGSDRLEAQALGIRGSRRLGQDALWIEPVAGFDYASGDQDPLDGRREELFNFFPTNHLHYGYLDLFGWRNLVSPWGGLGFGGQGHVFQLKLHGFWLAEPAGRWSSASGATLGLDPEGASGEQLGSELDLTYQKTFYDVLKLHLGLARFAPAEAARALRGADPAYLGYLEASIAF